METSCQSGDEKLGVGPMTCGRTKPRSIDIVRQHIAGGRGNGGKPLSLISPAVRGEWREPSPAGESLPGSTTSDRSSSPHPGDGCSSIPQNRVELVSRRRLDPPHLGHGEKPGMAARSSPVQSGISVSNQLSHQFSKIGSRPPGWRPSSFADADPSRAPKRSAPDRCLERGAPSCDG